VEAIGRNSNLGHLCKEWAGLRKSIDKSLPRPLLSQSNGPKPRAKRFLTADAVTDIVRRYEGGETTQHVGKRYGISKTRVASILTYHGVPIRRQGLNEEQVNESARLYIAGKSLAWIGVVPVLGRGKLTTADDGKEHPYFLSHFLPGGDVREHITAGHWPDESSPCARLPQNGPGSSTARSSTASFLTRKRQRSKSSWRTSWLRCPVEWHIYGAREV
jgi:hypothetical protein